MLTDEQCAELGKAVAEIMGEFARMEDNTPDGFEVDNACIKFYLGDSAGKLVGNWTVTVKREGFD